MNTKLHISDDMALRFSASDYLKARIRHLPGNADLEPDSKKRFEILRHVQQLSRRLRRNEGQSIWAPVIFAVCIAGMFTVLLYLARPKFEIWQAPRYQVRVLRQMTDYDFMTQIVEDGVPQVPSAMYFCHDFRPRLEAGMTLTRLAYDHFGSCLSISMQGNGYTILRDSSKDTCPVVPSNCRHIDCADKEHDHILCEGTPQFN